MWKARKVHHGYRRADVVCEIHNGEDREGADEMRVDARLLSSGVPVTVVRLFVGTRGVYTELVIIHPVAVTTSHKIELAR